MAKKEPRKEFDHRSQGGAWAAESTSDGQGWKPAGRREQEREQEPRRIIAL